MPQRERGQHFPGQLQAGCPPQLQAQHPCEQHQGFILLRAGSSQQDAGEATLPQERMGIHVNQVRKGLFQGGDLALKDVWIWIDAKDMC